MNEVIEDKVLVMLLCATFFVKHDDDCPYETYKL